LERIFHKTGYLKQNDFQIQPVVVAEGRTLAQELFLLRCKAQALQVVAVCRNVEQKWPASAYEPRPIGRFIFSFRRGRPGVEMGKAAIATIVGYVSLGVAAIGWILH
jgi:hypothetical protein